MLSKRLEKKKAALAAGLANPGPGARKHKRDKARAARRVNDHANRLAAKARKQAANREHTKVQQQRAAERRAAKAIGAFALSSLAA